jgi:tRNA-dihydrouridine synthase A
MITAEAVIHGDQRRLLQHDPASDPVVLQLGGSDPARLAVAARIGQDFGYAEINLNCGCPSDRVRSGAFGACLMAEPDRVAECVDRIRGAVSIPVTVKNRIAIDELPARETLFGFVETVSAAGCNTFFIHARKAWLDGLSPKENREIPPLDYGLVAELKSARPDLRIILNGGITSLEACVEHLLTFDGVMLGRAAYQNPGLLCAVDEMLFGIGGVIDEADAVRAFFPYLEARLSEGTPLHAMTRHMLGLFAGQPGARQWRRLLSERARLSGAGREVLELALSEVNAARANRLVADARHA